VFERVGAALVAARDKRCFSTGDRLQGRDGIVCAGNMGRSPCLSGQLVRPSGPTVVCRSAAQAP